MGVEDGKPADGGAPKTSPARTALIIVLYLGLNSSLNLLNRYTLGHAGFRYPVSLTCAHLTFQICSLAPVVFSGKPVGETHVQTVGRLWKALVAIGGFMGSASPIGMPILVDSSRMVASDRTSVPW